MSEKLNELKTKLSQLEQLALKEIKNSKSSYELDQVKSQFIGKKSDLAAILKDVSFLSKDDKPLIGKLANQIKSSLNDTISKQKDHIQHLELEEKLLNQQDDVSLPALKSHEGYYHPITLTIDHLTKLFGRLGFSVKKGPDIETDFYNFEALNIAEHHPARDMHDTFYLKSGAVLRTHTSPVQIRTMLDQKPPIKIIAPGKVYRC